MGHHLLLQRRIEGLHVGGKSTLDWAAAKISAADSAALRDHHIAPVGCKGPPRRRRRQ